MVDPKDPAFGNGNQGLSGNGTFPDALVNGSAALASPQGSGASPLAGPVGEAADVPQDEEREVDWGGTKRRMKVSELVKLAQQTEEARSIKAAADLQLREVAALKGVADRLRKASPQEREAFKRWAQGDSSMLSAPQPRGNGKDQDDLLDEETAGAPARDTASTARIDKIERAVMQMLDVMQGQVDERREVDTIGQIDAAMKQFPVFEGSSTLAKQARAHILDKLLRDGENGNLLGTVTEYARQSQSILDEHVGRSQSPQARGIPDLRPGTQKARSAKDLLDGTVDRDVSARLLGLRR